MFGFLYTLLGLGAYTTGIIKNGYRDAQETERAVKAGKPTYTDTKGRTREIVSNDRVLYKKQERTGDWGYQIIEPKSKNHGKFVNLEDARRREAWKRAHEIYLRDGKYYNEYDREVTEIDYESNTNFLDDQNDIYNDPVEGFVFNRGRACKGHRFRDIATGKIMVKRSLNLDDGSAVNGNSIDDLHKSGACNVFIDVDDGKIIRRVLPVSPNSSKEWQQRVDDFIIRYNKEQDKKIAAGVKERDPKDFYKNDWTFSNQRFFTLRRV